ncbi:MAG: BrnT family toxin [Desulfobulbaceae bacterium]|nr:BrnT family toxin [Desulfobulbaceae bacterium]
MPNHHIQFSLAQYAFAAPSCAIAEDLAHSETEKRYFCFGEVEGGVLTVRFTYRGGVIRIFGAGYWRKGKAIYERENQIHQ